MSKSSKKLTRSVADCARAVKEITEEVQELLLHEKNDSEERARTMTMWEELGDGEDEKNIVINILEETKASLEQLTKQSKLTTAREMMMKQKIEKKKIDIQRHTKLFASLNDGVQPTHQNEYEQLEEALIAEYERYVLLVRSIDYCQAEAETYMKQKLERSKRSQRSFMRMQEALCKEEAANAQHEDEFDNVPMGSPSSSTQSSFSDSSRSDESLDDSVTSDDLTDSLGGNSEDVRDDDDSDDSSSNF